MIFDLHNDFLTSNLSDTLLKSTFADYNNDIDVAKITLALWTTQLKNPTNDIFGLVEKANNVDTKKFLFAIEDFGFASVKNIDKILSLFPTGNLLYVGLTWNYANALAGGALSSDGLTPLGKDIIRILESHGVLIDTAHLNRQSFWDVLDFARTAVINSHTCFNFLNNHPRNLDERQISAILECGGIVGLTLVPSFLSQNAASLLDVFAHIDYFIERFGYQQLAIGTDFFGSASPSELNCYKDFAKLGDLMRYKGYDNEVVTSVFYKNALDFLDKRT